MILEEMLQSLPDGYQAISLAEARTLSNLVSACLSTKGDIAEVGVYRGGSAFVISKVKGKKKLHLFDTFEGLPVPSEKDGQFKQGSYYGTLEEAKGVLKGEKNIRFYKGLFPKTAKPIENKKFCFVHLDADLYQSTLDSLLFFWPRMSEGGIILLHDYQTENGIRQAVKDSINTHVLEIKGYEGFGETNSYGFIIKQ